MRVFIHPSFAKNPLAKLLAKQFKLYKSHNIKAFSSFRFGKDAPFHWPSSAKQAELQHVHIVPVERTENTSDVFLVYAQGFTDPNCYVLLSVLSPNAHEQANNTLIMSALADLAEQFRAHY